MQLGLSSEAAMDAPVSELLVACVRRGLGALELVLNPAIGPDDVLVATRMTNDIAVRISGIVADGCPDTQALAVLSRMADAPIIVRGEYDLPGRIACAREICLEGGTALVFVSGPPDSWLDTVTYTGVEFAWHVDETCQDPAAAAERILHARRIAAIRLAGGGPETAMLDERGIGALVRTLAIAGYDGPLIMTPSSQRYRVVWAAWLGRRGGWGCGSKADKTGRTVPLKLERGMSVADSR